MSQPIQPTQSTLLGHPKGLFILFLTEMWERFSFFGMKAILIFFLTDHLAGGLGWTESKACYLLGIYGMSVYVLGILGGAVADRYIGQKAAVVWGGLLACLGHFLLAIHHETIFIIGLCSISMGVGLLKPNISAMVGALYAQGDLRRDSGFSLFYMGINLGGLLASIFIGYIGETYGWHYGFGLAGIGMLIGLMTFLLGQSYLANIGEKPRIQQKTNLITQIRLPKRSFSREDKDRLVVITVSFIAVFTFFAAFQQAGGLMNLFAKKYTNRYFFGWEIPASMLQGLNPAFGLLLSPIIATFWVQLAKRFKNISSIYKMGIGNIIVGISFLFMIGASLEKNHSINEQCALHWLINTYLLQTIGELCISPVSLSFITKAAPENINGFIIGIFFAVIGLANHMAALLGRAAINTWDELTIFQLIFWITLIIGLVFLFFNRRLVQLTHGAEDVTKI